MLPRLNQGFVQAALICGLLMLGACASTPPKTSATDTAAADMEEGPNDPFENVNRAVFDFNITLDDYVLKPVAKGYRTVTPLPIRKGVSNFLSNLGTPVRLANDALQGNGERAGQTFLRFWYNTFLGVGGLIDVGTALGVPYHDADFGQTLGVYGMGTGPYLMLPLLGPSNPRDAVGYGVDSFADPFTQGMSAANHDIANYVRAGVSIVSNRAQNIDELDELRRGSLDFYATVRSLYQQKRAGDVRAAGGKSPQPSISYNPDDAGKSENAAQVTPSVAPQKAF
ncbi:MAG TPA: VacJ family lipoprotein [Stellaceae bacterium]|nr:VacJ family lipoprotein [Stellaceae bacterium]